MTRHTGRHSRPSRLASVAALAVRAVQHVRAIRVTFGSAARSEVRDDDFTRAGVHTVPLVPFSMAADDLPATTSYPYPSKGDAA